MNNIDTDGLIMKMFACKKSSFPCLTSFKLNITHILTISCDWNLYSTEKNYDVALFHRCWNHRCCVYLFQNTRTINVKLSMKQQRYEHYSSLKSLNPYKLLSLYQLISFSHFINPTQRQFILSITMRINRCV